VQLLFTGEKCDRRAELSYFLQRFPSGKYMGVAVKEMRHIIPLLLMEVYLDGQYSHKGRGFF
jgi:hypothetical protein